MITRSYFSLISIHCCYAKNSVDAAAFHTAILHFTMHLFYIYSQRRKTWALFKVKYLCNGLTKWLHFFSQYRYIRIASFLQKSARSDENFLSGKGIEENGFCHFSVVGSEMRVSRKPFKKEEKPAGGYCTWGGPYKVLNMVQLCSKCSFVFIK